MTNIHNYKRNIHILTLIASLRSMIFVIPVILLYYEQRVGIGFRELLIGEAVFAATLLFFDMPASYLSDRWNRRKVLILSQVFCFLGLLALTLAQSFLMVIAAQFLLGIAFAMSSNTDSSLLYDTLLSAGKEQEFSRHEGRRSAFGFYAIALSSLAGGFLFGIYYNLPNILTLCIYVFGLVISFFLIEPEKHKIDRHKNPVYDAVIGIYQTLRDNVGIGLMILFSAMLFSATKIMMWSQQAYYAAMGLDAELFGILSAVGFVLAGFSAHLAHMLGRVLTPVQVMITGLGLVVISSLVAGFTTSWLGVVALMFGGTCIYGLVNPHFVAAVNHRLSSGRRATILSTAGILRNIFFIMLSISCGEIIGLYDLQAGYFMILGWLALAGTVMGAWRILSLYKTRRRKAKA